MSSPQRIVLYSGPTSPYALRVRLALEEAGAKYQLVSFDMDEKPDWFLSVNPAGKVPTVVYGGPEAPPEKPSPESVTIVESLVLLEFVASLFPDAGLLPKDPVRAAKARFFISTLEERLGPELGPWLTDKSDGSGVVQLLEHMQALLPSEGYAIGEWSIADAAFVPFLLSLEVITRIEVGYWVKLTHAAPVKDVFTSPRFARLQKYITDSKARPSVKATWDADLVTKKWLKRFAKDL